MDRWITLAFAGAALVACVLAAARVIAPVVDADAALENPGGAVLDVQPGGIAWQDGIRAGQTVVSLSRADEPGGWRIVTRRDDGAEVVSRAAPHERKLRASWPLATFAFGAFALSAAWVRRRPRESELASVVAIGLAAAPLSIDAGPGAALFALPAAIVIPAAWLARWSPSPSLLRLSPLAIAGAVGASWLVARFAADPAFDAVDQVRFTVTVALTGLVLVTAAAMPAGKGGRWLAEPQVSVGLSLALLIAVGLVLANVVRVPLAAVVAGAAVGIIAFPSLRRLIGTVVDRLFFADVRAQSAVAALEAERARVAREIHDAPLQEISGVIRQLDRRSEVDRETDVLRGVADQLRSIATELYPPVLEDLGLAAALRSAVQRAQDDHPDLTISSDISGLEAVGGRPPADVELAMLRIAQEAMSNAIRHSGASRIVVEAEVSPDFVRVSVRDDGRGIGRAAARLAQEAGHMGLVSMQQRAASIGGHLERSAVTPTGTRIEIRWQR